MTRRAAERLTAEHLLTQAGLVRRLFPSVAAMQTVALPPAPPLKDTDPGDEHLRAAIRCLHDELRLVQAGSATVLFVLDDEIANTRAALADTAL